MKQPRLLAFALPPLVGACLIVNGVVNSAQAAPRPYSEARAAAMGYTGTASARSVGTLLHNPALLAAPHAEHQDNWGLMLPSLGVSAIVEEDVLDKVDEFQDDNLWDNMQNSINELNAINDVSTVQEVTSALQAVVDDATVVNQKLLELDNSAVGGNLGGAIGFARPSSSLGVGVHITTNANFLAIAEYNDEEEVNDVIDTAEALLAIENPTSDDLNSDIITDLAFDDPDSEGEIVGIAISEIGVTLARSFEIANTQFQVGVTPKYQEIRTFLYLANLDSLEKDDFDAAEQETKESAFNLDLGLATQLGESKAITVGMMVRNLVPREVDTISALNSLGDDQFRTFELEPSVQVGVSYDAEHFTLTADLDLTETKAFAFEGDRQMIALGAEADLARWVQVRAGVRHNLASDSSVPDSIDAPTLFTAGLGFTPGIFYFDLAGGISDKEYSAGLEMGVLY